MNELICRNEQRREQVRRQRQLNGLDYLEVGEPGRDEPSLAGQRILRVVFLGKAEVAVERDNVRIEGGVRIRDIEVLSVEMQRYHSAELDDAMLVTVDRAGDFSRYTLRLVERGDEGQWRPHSGFDPRYDRVDFSFKAECPSDLDCQPVAVCPQDAEPEPDINYLAKDYASFRQLILDRLALVMPRWRERHVPDIGIALVEVLAYVGDHLSYYQDAVAIEAYLGTARKRISVRRHARLVDYHVHEGCNARAWVCVQTDTDLTDLDPADWYFITGHNDAFRGFGKVVDEQQLSSVAASEYEVFEPISQGAMALYRSHNKIRFYTWSDRECCLPQGATRATLIGELAGADIPPPGEPCDDDDGDERGDAPTDEDPQDNPPGAAPAADAPDPALPQAQGEAPKLYLKPGDVLLFEEVVGPTTGVPGDADPTHRHAVRLTEVAADNDPLTGCPVVHIAWAQQDQLPFPLCLSSLGPPPECAQIANVSIACGNVILVDHGRSREEDLGAVPTRATRDCCKAEGVVGDTERVAATYRPQLARVPLTFSQPLAPGLPAAQSLDQDARRALPQVWLTGNLRDAISHWSARLDLLASGPEDLHFVAEMDEEGRAHLRFGDDEAGEQPDASMHFNARYRTGNGLAGNVGAEAISHIVMHNLLSGVTLSARNPLPARGGAAPEPLAEVKLFAPHAFSSELQRAITAVDYAAIVEREFPQRVQKAAASLRWTGSGYEVLVAVDAYHSDAASPQLLTAVSGRLHRYRRIGHDLVVISARKVPLDIALLVCVLPDYLRGHVKAALLDMFSNRRLADGTTGVFHPDNLTFGDDIYLSRLVALTQSVTGVQSVQVTRLQRQHHRPNQEIENGVLPLGPFEVARLDNDPSLPEHGRLTLDVRGGR